MSLIDFNLRTIGEMITLKGFTQMLVYASALIIVSANITSFHLIPSWYTSLMTRKDGMFVQFVTKAQRLPEFESFSPAIQDRIAEESDFIYADYRKRMQVVSHLEQKLSLYPQSTELLRALIVLYAQNDDAGRVKEYSDRLQKLDPQALTKLQGSNMVQ